MKIFAVVALVTAFSCVKVDAYHELVPIEFTNANIPYTDVEIEGNIYLFEIDTGSNFPLSMEEGMLDGIRRKELLGVEEWRDIKGNEYETPTYLIPRFNIGEVTFLDVIVQQEHDEFSLNTTIWEWEDKDEDPDEIKQGSIGLPLLEKQNMLLDFAHHVLFFSNNRESLKEEGYDLESMAKVPFTIEEGIILQIETDQGLQNFVVDTGCTVTLIRSSSSQEQSSSAIISTSLFILGEKDFGKRDLYFYEVSTDFEEIDGLLGMDFLDEHIVYFDFENQIAYIRKV